MNTNSRNVRKWVRSQRRSRRQALVFWKRRWRSALVRAAEKLVVGDSISSVLVPDISSLSRLKTAMDHVHEIKLIQDAEIIYRPFSSQEATFPVFGDTRRAIFRYVIQDAVIHLDSGLANVCGGFLVEELFGHYLGVFSGGTVAHEYYATTRRARHIEGYWAAVGIPRYYFHFVTQSLPSLIRAIEHQNTQGILASSRMPNWAKEALETLNVQVVYLADEIVEIENYICCSIAEVISKNDIEIVRERYSSYLSTRGRNLAFVGRGHRNRSLGSMESEIAELVKARGGSEVDPETLGWEKELEFFSSCDRVIMVYGSATANIVWMKPGTKVLLLTAFDGFTTQIEKSLFDAAGVQFTELDTTGLSVLNADLQEELIRFINQ